jgi:hypothetical protein
MPEVGLTLGGFRATLRTSESAVVEAARRRWGRFIGDGPSDWIVRVEVEPGDGRANGGVVVRNEGTGRFLLSRYDFRGVLDLGRRVADVTIIEPDELTLDSLLRVTLTLALLPTRGLLVHAAALARNGRGYLFPGVSGAGKTTLARLSPQARLLSDELSIVSTPEAAVVHGTPFRGELARGGEPLSVPLAGIFFLRHAASHAVTPLAEQAALRRLLATVMSFAREPEVVGRVFGLAADLVARVPCSILDFRPDPGFWEIIEHG